MKRILKSKLSVIRFFSLIFVSLAFISCGNLFENVKLEKEKTEEETQINSENPTAPVNQTFILTGSMVIDGAMPQIIAADASRSALPELSASTVEYFVYATDGDGNTVDGSFGSDENAKTFSIPLIFGRTWTITCGMRNKNGSQEEFLTASSTPKTYTATNYTDPLVLYPAPATSGKGEVELSISIPSSITNVTVSCVNAAWTISTVDVTAGSGTTNGTALLKTGTTEDSKINSGLYKITLNFYKGTELVFQTLQSINVFYGLKTNKWYDAAAQASASPIQSDGTFVLTENHVKQFISTNFYVGSTSASTTSPSDTNIGSHKAPFATLERALAQIENYGLATNDYKIHISDLYFPDTSATEGYTISSSFDSKMKSLTLTGLSAVNANGISGNDRFRALTISTSKKVTIKNLTITNGKAEDGAGIYYSGTGKLIIDNCIISYNEATHNGGGIYSSGNVQIISTTIKENDITGENAGTGEGLYIFSGSVTMTGGEISQNISQLADSGAIFVRKSAEFNFNGGLISNNGSRAINNHGTVNMTAGTISGHTAMRGGAIYNNGSLNISGGSITGNSSTKNAEGAGGNGGAIYVNGADTTVTPNVIPSLEITGGTITANTAECFGGGIFNASKLTVSGGEISGNYITGTVNCGGGAVAVYSETIIKDDAYIPAGTDGKNDIFLYDSGDYLTKHRVYIGSSLTQDQTIKLTPKIYSDNRPMIELAASSTADLAVEYTKFAAGPDEGGYNYTISNAGLLKADLSVLINKNVTGSSFAGTSTISESEVFVSGRSFNIRPIEASDHEVTQGEYETYCIYSGSGSEVPNIDVGKGCFYPVYYVSWYDAIVYCNLRTIAEMGIEHCVYSIGDEKDPSQWDGKTAGTGVNAGKYCGPISTERNDVWDTVTMDPTADGWRLPVEVEWEYLAREGKLTGEQYTYSGNNNIDNVAYYKGSPETKNGTKAHEVKGKTANDLGLYDMTGNVFEWVWDWFTSPLDSAITYQGPTYAQANSGKEKVFCGGAYSKNASDCKLNKRGWYQPPHLRFGDIGFRVVRGALEEAQIGSKGPSEPKEVGDIVFNDGSAMPYSDYAVLDTDSQAALKTSAIALIFYRGNDLNSGSDTAVRTLGLGLVIDNTSGLQWCYPLAKAQSKYIDTIQCQPNENSYPFTFDPSCDKDGSDNFTQIALKLKSLSDATNDLNDTGEEGSTTSSDEALANYPAFGNAKMYYKERLEGESESRIGNKSQFKFGWYLPSFAELAEIYKYYITTGSDFNINTASAALGGGQFEDDAYLSSSQYNDSNVPDLILTLDFATGNMADNIKDYDYPCCFIREF